MECVDTVLGKISQKSDLDIALVKCTKLPSLLTIGNCGEVINMIDNEIMPVFDGYLGKPYTKEDIPARFSLRKLAENISCFGKCFDFAGQ